MNIVSTVWLVGFLVVLAIKSLDYIIPYLIKRHQLAQRLIDDNIELARMIKDRE